MRRDATLHIKKSDLIQVLSELRHVKTRTPTKAAEKIFELAQPYQLTDRYLKILNQKTKTKKKLARSMAADDVPHATVEKVNLYIYDARGKKNKMARIKAISKDSQQYLQLKEVAKMAVDFTAHFEITPKSDGIKHFIDAGIEMMGKYSLNRFRTYEQSIYEHFDNWVKCANDDKKESTLEMYGAWQTMMVEYTGNEDLITIDKDLQKYVHIIYAREAADKYKANYIDWVQAQFEGLSFLNKIPILSQFYGDNAKKRYDGYLTTSVDSKDQSKDNVLNIYD